MASRRGLALLVASLLILAACTVSTTPPPPTAPPDAFASTPTIGPSTTTRPAPTTTLDVERATIQRVDSRSLEPLPGFEPIPMGDWVSNWSLSPNRQYLAAYVGPDNAGANEVRLIDISAWSQAAVWPTYADSELHVTNDGTVIYSLQEQLRRLRVGEPGQPVVADLPEGYVSWGSGHLTDELFGMFVTRFVSPTVPEEAKVLAVDTSTGEVAEFDLPEVSIGQVDPISQGPWAGYLYTSPSVTWDPAGPRALVVHGDEDVVSEVDLGSGVVTEHTFLGFGVDESTGSRRWSAISPDGTVLYVTNTEVTLIGDDDDWSVTTAPAGVIAVDTSTWEVVARTDAPISEIHLSPDGDRLLATGYETEESESVSHFNQSGLFVLDPTDLELVTHHPPERADQGYWPITFNDADGVAYVSSWIGQQRIDALDLATGEVLATVENPEYLEIIGPVGVLASTS